MRQFIKSIWIIIAVMLIALCSTPKPAFVIDEEFRKIPQKNAPDTLISSFDEKNVVSGKARIVVSQSNGQNRGIANFEISENASLFKLKNGVGIKGGWIFVDDANLVQYDALSNQTKTLSKAEIEYSENSWLTIDPLIFVNPWLEIKKPIKWFESKSYIKLIDADGNQLLWKKGNNEVFKRYLSAKNSDWVIEYDLWRKSENESIPGKITGHSDQLNTTIFMLVQEFSLSKNGNVQMPEIP